MRIDPEKITAREHEAYERHVDAEFEFWRAVVHELGFTAEKSVGSFRFRCKGGLHHFRPRTAHRIRRAVGKVLGREITLGDLFQDSDLPPLAGGRDFNDKEVRDAFPVSR